LQRLIDEELEVIGDVAERVLLLAEVRTEDVAEPRRVREQLMHRDLLRDLLVRVIGQNVDELVGELQLPASTSCAMETDVNIFGIDPRRKRVSRFTGIFFSRSCRPNALCQSGLPSFAITTTPEN
jgi:hypothetical protein